MRQIMEANYVELEGRISGALAYSNETKTNGESFYSTFLRVERKSGDVDVVPLLVSERLVDVSQDIRNMAVRVSGQFRSYNKWENGRSHLLLSVFVQKLEFLKKALEKEKTNLIRLDGYLCKKPVYRKTPLGREVTDLFLAVNRIYGKTDYIPCVCWGRDARYAFGMEVGSHVKLHGRIQSRTYIKRWSETEKETRTAYEVSVWEITKIIE